MPVNPVVPGCAKIAVLQHVGTTTLVNTFYVDTGGIVTVVQADALESAVEDAWAFLLPDLSDAYLLDEIVVTDVSMVGGGQFTYAPALAGTDAANPIPPQSAAGVSWRTASVGRSYRGRSYLGGFTETVSQGNALTAGLISDLEDWRDTLITEFNAVGTFVVVSRYTLNPTPPPSSIPRGTNITTPIISGLVTPGWETQRRRARF